MVLVFGETADGPLSDPGQKLETLLHPQECPADQLVTLASKLTTEQQLLSSCRGVGGGKGSLSRVVPVFHIPCEEPAAKQLGGRTWGPQCV